MMSLLRRVRSSFVRSFWMPRVTLSKSISRAAFGACTGGWLKCRAGRISGRVTSLARFRAPRAARTPLDAPGRTRRAAGQRGDREVGNPQGSLLGGPRGTLASSAARGIGRVAVARKQERIGSDQPAEFRWGGGLLVVGSRSAELGLAGERQIEHEVETRAVAWRGFDLERRAHCLDQLAANREPETGPREGILPRLLPSAERLVQGGHALGRNAAAGIANGELDRAGTGLPRRDLDEALGRELERVGRQVEQHAAQRHRMPDAEIRFRRGQLDGETLLF